jgi:acetylornithine deacetylase/succinyl-diaminopimelate desuccinylase-like protein
MTQDQQLEYLFQFLRFQSVSTDSTRNAQTQACADWLSALYTAHGLESHVCETPGHPVVLARTAHQPGKPTVLIYGHYDVQPEDPVRLWKSEPFEPVVREGRIWARGSTDNKGQIMAHTLGVFEAIGRLGQPPVNVIFLVEGEEEIGSPHLAPFVQEHADELRADIIAISDTGMLAPGLPTFTYGLRGVACAEVLLEGPAHDLHSGVYGGAVVNPATVLSRLIASLHDEEWRIQVAGLYDDVLPLEPWEREAWAKLPFDDETMKAVSGAPELDGEAGYTSLERTYARPTVEVNGITAGYQGEGSKTVLPSQASAKFSCRTVPSQRGARVLERLKAHFEARLPAGVRMRFEAGHTGEAYVTDPHSPFGQAAPRALKTTFGAEVALIREGGSIPIVQEFKDILGLDTLLLGLALPDAGMHAPNENFPLESFYAGIRLNQALLEEIARSQS